jgi:hypothetical protein
VKFVVDTNIIFSAVLNTEGKIGDLIMNSHGVLEFHACDTLRSELKKHRPKLLDLSQMSSLSPNGGGRPARAFVALVCCQPGRRAGV